MKQHDVVRRRGREPVGTRGTILFFHGLWTNGTESLLLRHRLRARGWRAHVMPFSSLRDPVDRVAARAAYQIQALATETRGPVHMVGHSLGGLIVHQMLERHQSSSTRLFDEECRIVFLGVPTQGCASARALAQSAVGRRLLGIGGGALLEMRDRRWSWPPRLGVVAGTKPLGIGRTFAQLDSPNDGEVAVSETRVSGCAAQVEVPTSHIGLITSARVAALVDHFLHTGSFVTGEPSSRSGFDPV